MKKIFFILLVIAIIFISLYKPLDIDLIIDGIYAFVDMLSILVYFMLAFWLWGQIFIIHSNVVYPLHFLILRSIYFNIQITVFIFSIFLLFFEQAYISKELLIIYLSITNFYAVLFSCFYMALKDFFYKDEEITYSKVFKKFIENILR